jgi:hypothetical protein
LDLVPKPDIITIVEASALFLQTPCCAMLIFIFKQVENSANLFVK